MCLVKRPSTHPHSSPPPPTLIPVAGLQLEHRPYRSKGLSLGPQALLYGPGGPYTQLVDPGQETPCPIEDMVPGQWLNEVDMTAMFDIQPDDGSSGTSSMSLFQIWFLITWFCWRRQSLSWASHCWHLSWMWQVKYPWGCLYLLWKWACIYLIYLCDNLYFLLASKWLNCVPINPLPYSFYHRGYFRVFLFILHWLLISTCLTLFVVFLPTWHQIQLHSVKLWRTS